MGVYTRLSREDTAAFVAGYGLDPPESMEPIAQGIENTNYRVGTSNGAWVLTVFEREPAESAEETLRLTAELAARDVPCPRPLRGPDGYVGRIAGKPAALVPFVAGEIVWSPSEAHMEEIGRVLAGLHRAGRDLPFDRAGPHLARVLVPWARSQADRLDPDRPDLAALLREEADLQEGVDEGELPGGVIHADLFLDNLLFDPQRPKVRAMLDFYLAGRGPWLYDLAVVLLDAGWGGRGIVGDRARALLRGYRGVRPLEPAEYRLVPQFLRRAALRFLCLRIERSLLDSRVMAAGAAKDPEEYAAKLRELRRVEETSG